MLVGVRYAEQWHGNFIVCFHRILCFAEKIRKFGNITNLATSMWGCFD